MTFYGNAPLNYAIAALTFAAIASAVVLARRYGPLSRRLRARRDAGRATAFERYALAQIDGVFVPVAVTGACFAALIGTSSVPIAVRATRTYARSCRSCRSSHGAWRWSSSSTTGASASPRSSRA
jgi:hypothetical protein